MPEISVDSMCVRCMEGLANGHSVPLVYYKRHTVYKDEYIALCCEHIMPKDNRHVIKVITSDKIE